MSGAKVMFGGQSLSTKFVSATELTATGTATTAQKGMSVQVTVANPDPGTMTSAALMVKVGVIAVAITPTTANLFPGQTVQLKATVSGTTNQAVNWMVNGVVGGAANVGTISSTGLYTAPKTYLAGQTGFGSQLPVLTISSSISVYSPCPLKQLPRAERSPPRPDPRRELYGIRHRQQLPERCTDSLQRNNVADDI